MKDIARELGVSVVTVSKVLRNNPDISEETRERVLRKMKELNYRPNLAARALVTGRTFTIGFVVPDLVHPFFSEVAKGLTPELRKQGYSLLIASSEEDPELEQQEIEQMLNRQVDAVIVASAQWTVESFRRIEEHQTPYVLLDRKFLGLPANFVGVDDEAVGVLATRHLIEQGCRRIAHLRGLDASTAVGRYEGYRRTLSEHQMPMLPGYVIEGKSLDARADVSGYDAMKKLLALPQLPDGVFCYNDPTAMGAIRAIFEAGLRVPEDISVIGCGNVFYADLLRVPLTSVDQNSAGIGQQAALLALSLIASKTVLRPRSVLLEPRIVARQSTARPQ